MFTLKKNRLIIQLSKYEKFGRNECKKVGKSHQIIYIRI